MSGCRRLKAPNDETYLQFLADKEYNSNSNKVFFVIKAKGSRRARVSSICLLSIRPYQDMLCLRSGTANRCVDVLKPWELR